MLPSSWVGCFLGLWIPFSSKPWLPWENSVFISRFLARLAACFVPLAAVRSCSGFPLPLFCPSTTSTLCGLSSQGGESYICNERFSSSLISANVAANTVLTVDIYCSVLEGAKTAINPTRAQFHPSYLFQLFGQANRKGARVVSEICLDDTTLTGRRPIHQNPFSLKLLFKYNTTSILINCND